MNLSRLSVRQVRRHLTSELDRGAWPGTLAPVRQLWDEGLEMGSATVLVGENGSGKSTIVEAIASAYGLSVEGGSTGAEHSTRRSESSLDDQLHLIRNPGASRRGYLLRAETMHGFFTYLEMNPGTSRIDLPFHEMSHGESFLDLVRDRFRGPGLWVMDEPESALSFAGCLGLLSVLLDRLANGDSQVLLATHSPLLASLPGARVLEVGPWGLRSVVWEDLELVHHWRRFLEDPGRYHRHL